MNDHDEHEERRVGGHSIRFVSPDVIATTLVGSLEPSPLLVQSGNALPADDLAELRRLGAVGDVCFRFFDEDGSVRELLESPYEDVATVG